MEFEESYFVKSSLSKLVRRVRGSKSQGDVVEKTGVAQPNISKIENNPGSLPGVAIEVIEKLSDYQFEEEPRYKVRHHRTRELTSDVFESLAYHLRLLFYMKYRGSGSSDLVAIGGEFPGHPFEGSGPRVETEERKIQVGNLCEGASMALEDLLTESLVDFRKFEVFSLEERREELRRWYRNVGKTRSNGFSESQIQSFVDQAVKSKVGVQPEGTWYVDNGEQIDLEGKGINCSFQLTNEGRKIVTETFGSLFERLRPEWIKQQAGLDDDER